MAKAKISKKVKLAHAGDMYELLERLVANNAISEEIEFGNYLSNVEDIEADAWSLIQTMQQETEEAKNG